MNRLSWSLAIATYQRPDMLLRCLALGAEQSRQPLEVVVVDASPDWEGTRDRVMRDLAPRYPEITWNLHRAERPSAAAQRHQCVCLAKGDVLFLIDDDSLMYPDCAERIMEVYEADNEKKIVAVAAELAASPPDRAPAGAVEATTPVSHPAPIAWMRRLLGADDIFVPYDEEFPQHTMPAEVEHLNLGHRALIAGMRMTVRRECALEENFETCLERSSQGEDSDVSYRWSRRGKLVTAFDARLHHVGSPEGRVPSMLGEMLGGLNPAFLHVLYSSDRARSARRLRELLWRRLAIALLKDLRELTFGFPRSRGLFGALTKLRKIFSLSPDEARDWYSTYQRELFERRG